MLSGLLFIGPETLLDAPGRSGRRPDHLRGRVAARVLRARKSVYISARRLGRASVLGPGRLENLITKSYRISYFLIKLTVTPPYPPHGGSPDPWRMGGVGENFLLLRLFWDLGVIHFFIAFSLPFLIDLGSIFLPNLPPKIHQNR